MICLLLMIVNYKSAFRRVFTLTMEKLLEKTIIIVLNVVGFVKVSTKMVQKVKNGCYTVLISRGKGH